MFGLRSCVPMSLTNVKTNLIHPGWKLVHFFSNKFNYHDDIISPMTGLHTCWRFASKRWRILLFVSHIWALIITKLGYDVTGNILPFVIFREVSKMLGCSSSESHHATLLSWKLREEKPNNSCVFLTEIKRQWKRNSYFEVNITYSRQLFYSLSSCRSTKTLKTILTTSCDISIKISPKCLIPETFTSHC